MRWGRWVAAGSLAVLVALAVVLPAQAETTGTAVTAREAGSGLATGRRQVQGLERVKAVAASGDLYAALMGDGSVRVVGDLDGDGTIDLTPQTIDMGCPARSVSVGAGSLAAVCADGSVMLAQGIINTSRSNIKGQRVAGLSSVKAVSLGRPGLVALRSDGTVWFADKGINEPGIPPAAVQVPDLSGVVAIAAGIDDAVAVHADGSASRMAINTKGIPSKRIAGLPPVQAVSVCGPDDDCDGTDGYLFVTAKGEAVMQVTGADGTQKLLTLGSPVCNPCAVAGHARAILLTHTGYLLDSVDAPSGKVTVSDVSWPPPQLKQVATGRSLDMGLAVDGTVWVWDAPRPVTQVDGLENVREVVAGDNRACAITGSGQVLCWGSNTAAKAFVVPHVLEVSHMSVTKDYWMALHTDGSISIGLWPADGKLTAEPVIHRDVAARAAGNCCRGHVIIMKFDGTVEDASIAIDEQGAHLTDFKPVQGLERVIQVAGTAYGYLAIRSDGTVYTGRADRPPTQVKELSGAISAACGSSACAVAMGDGSVRGIAIDEPGVHIWGDPHVDEAVGSVAVGGGGSGGVIAIRADGTVVRFGEKVSAGLVTDAVDAIAVTANAQWNLLLRADGTVWRWRASSL